MRKMKAAFGAVVRLAALPIAALSALATFAGERLEVKSPDGRVALAFETGAEGLRWSLNRDGKDLVAPVPAALLKITSRWVKLRGIEPPAVRRQTTN